MLGIPVIASPRHCCHHASSYTRPLAGCASPGHLLQLLQAGHKAALPAMLSTFQGPPQRGPACSPKAPGGGTRVPSMLVPPPRGDPFQGTLCSGPRPSPNVSCPHLVVLWISGSHSLQSHTSLPSSNNHICPVHLH